jgi:hypothetical protein
MADGCDEKMTGDNLGEGKDIVMRPSSPNDVWAAFLERLASVLVTFPYRTCAIIDLFSGIVACKHIHKSVFNQQIRLSLGKTRMDQITQN